MSQRGLPRAVGPVPWDRAPARATPEMARKAPFSGRLSLCPPRAWAILRGLLARFSAFHTARCLLGGTVTFEVGDKVIYPNHGLGIVERIEEKTILGTTCGFYHLRIVA